MYILQVNSKFQVSTLYIYIYINIYV